MVAIAVFALILAVAMFFIVRDRRQLHERRAARRGVDDITRGASERLYFRFAEFDDRDFFVAMAQDPTAADANGWNGGEVAAVRARFFSRKQFENTRGHELVALERATDHRIGTATFGEATGWPPNTLSVGIHVRPDHRRRGFGRELMAAAILVAQQASDQSVVVGTRTTNLQIQQMMDRLGYEREPDIRPYHAPNGTTYDSYWYQCHKPPNGLLAN